MNIYVLNGMPLMCLMGHHGNNWYFVKLNKMIECFWTHCGSDCIFNGCFVMPFLTLLMLLKALKGDEVNM